MISHDLPRTLQPVTLGDGRLDDCTSIASRLPPRLHIDCRLDCISIAASMIAPRSDLDCRLNCAAPIHSVAPPALPASFTAALGVARAFCRPRPRARRPLAPRARPQVRCLRIPFGFPSDPFGSLPIPSDRLEHVLRRDAFGFPSDSLRIPSDPFRSPLIASSTSSGEMPSDSLRIPSDSL